MQMLLQPQQRHLMTCDHARTVMVWATAVVGPWVVDAVALELAHLVAHAVALGVVGSVAPVVIGTVASADSPSVVGVVYP